MLQEFQSKKDKIIDIIYKLQALAGSYMILESDDKIFENLLIDFKEQLTFNVLCLGDFSSGKSTFVNKFFVGKELLTTRHTTTTAKLCVVKYGEVEKLNIIDIDGQKKSYISDLGNVLADFGAVDGENIDKVDFIELEIPSEILKEGVVVIDSPGLNDPEIERMNVTFDYIDRADCVLYFLNAQQAWKKNEKEFLEEKILRKKDLDKIFFILNYWDVVDNDDERQNLLKYVNKQISTSLEIAKANVMDTSLSDLPLVPVSSKTEENFDLLRNELGTYFTEKKGNSLIKIKMKKISSLISDIKKRLEDEIGIVEKDSKEIDANLKTIDDEYKSYKTEYDNFKVQVGEKFDELWDRFIDGYETIVKDISRDIGVKLGNKLRTIKNEKELQQFFMKHTKNVLYQHKVDFQRLDLELVRNLQQALKEYKAKLNLDNTLLGEYWSVDNFDTSINLELDHSEDEFMFWALGGAFGSAALMIGVGTSLSAMIAPMVGVPVLLASLYFGNVKDKENLQTAKSELLDNIDNEIYEQLISAFQSLYNPAKKTELFEKVFSHINSDIIESFKNKESIYINAKEVKDNNTENDKIKQLNLGLEKLATFDKELNQLY